MSSFLLPLQVTDPHSRRPTIFPSSFLFPFFQPPKKGAWVGESGSHPLLCVFSSSAYSEELRFQKQSCPSSHPAWVQNMGVPPAVLMSVGPAAPVPASTPWLCLCFGGSCLHSTATKSAPWTIQKMSSLLISCQLMRLAVPEAAGFLAL